MGNPLFRNIDNSIARSTWVRRTLEAIPEGHRILDVGCGEQIYRPCCSHLDYKSQDFGQYDGVGDKSGLQTGNWSYGDLDYAGNAWSIDEKDAFFDSILCTEVLEHVPYPEECIREFSRLLKPGGTLIVTAPFCSIPHMTPYFYYSGFSNYWYEFMAEKYGFNVLEISENGTPTEYVIQELHRLPASKPGKYLVRAMTPFIRWFLNKENPDLHFGFHVRMLKR